MVINYNQHYIPVCSNYVQSSFYKLTQLNINIRLYLTNKLLDAARVFNNNTNFHIFQLNIRKFSDLSLFFVKLL